MYHNFVNFTRGSHQTHTHAYTKKANEICIKRISNIYTNTITYNYTYTNSIPHLSYMLITLLKLYTNVHFIFIFSFFRFIYSQKYELRKEKKEKNKKSHTYTRSHVCIINKRKVNQTKKKKIIKLESPRVCLAHHITILTKYLIHCHRKR